MVHELLNGLSSAEAEQVLELGTKLTHSLRNLAVPSGRRSRPPVPNRTRPNQAYLADAGPRPGRGYFRGRNELPDKPWAGRP